MNISTVLAQVMAQVLALSLPLVSACSIERTPVVVRIEEPGAREKYLEILRAKNHKFSIERDARIYVYGTTAEQLHRETEEYRLWLQQRMDKGMPPSGKVD